MSTWKDDLANMFEKKKRDKEETWLKITEARAKFDAFVDDVVQPALHELSEELKKYERQVTFVSKASIKIMKLDESGMRQEEFGYSITLLPNATWAHPIPQITYRDKETGKSCTSQGYIKSGTQNYTVDDISKEDIITHFVTHYKNYVS